MRTFRTFYAAVATVAAAVAMAVVPAAPAAANHCDPVLGCTSVGHPDLPDVFGDPTGVPCLPVFRQGATEGSRQYWDGLITGATYSHPDVQTRRMTVTCSIRTSASYTGGEERGSETATSVAPLNFTVSAAGLTLTFYTVVPNEPIWLCTTVRWVDRAGVSHVDRIDHDDAVGDQCREMIWLPPLPV